jgi:predicted cobalt transporter CbtA
MDLSPGALIASLIVSAIGLGLFLYGKRAQRMPHLLCGIVLMVAPCFTGGPLLTSSVGAAALAGLWLAVRAGK